MSKRQEKVSVSQITSFINRQVNIILKSGAVHLVIPISTQEDILKALDTRGSKMLITLSEVAEIWAENKVV